MAPNPAPKRQLTGVDVFIYWTNPDINKLGAVMTGIAGIEMNLQAISSKGLKVFPDYTPGMNITEEFRCRFIAKDPSVMTLAHIAALLERVHQQDMDFTKIENLYTFDGKDGFTMGQGQ